MIAQTRLEHQAAQIQRGEKPDNFMAPGDLSDFERSHLRDAFVVIKTMQNAAGSTGGYLNKGAADPCSGRSYSTCCRLRRRGHRHWACAP
jgi:hypothetical protein